MSQTDPQKLAEVYRATAEVLAGSIAAKEAYTESHVSRVQRICELLAAGMGLDSETTCGICVAALVHDVGKLGVPEYILLKPGPLDPEEFARTANHAAIGAGILEKVDYPWNVAEMVRHHHEKFDGTGYPDHLVGKDIPLGSRIISIAEVYDALASERPYRQPWTHEEAVAYIEKLAGIHFDPDVVKAFLAIEPQIAETHQTFGHDSAPLTAKHPARTHPATAELIVQANRELMSLFEIAEVLSSTLEIDEVSALLAHRTMRLAQASTCAVLVEDKTRQGDLVARTAVGRCAESIREARAKIGHGTTGMAAARKRPYVGDCDPDDLWLGSDRCPTTDLASCMVAPMMSFGEVLGTINVYDVARNAFTQDDLRMLTFIASRAALAIQNALAFEAVRDSAMRDAVTGLYNIRYLRTYLEREISRASRLGEPLSVLELDLDNFKAVNDALGHQVGDLVLRDAAEIFKGQLRDYDLVARIGGDEFLIVLPGTPAHEADGTARRVRQIVKRYVRRRLGAAAPLGVSVGVASFPDDAEDLDSLLDRADAAMYRNKRARKKDQIAA